MWLDRRRLLHNPLRHPRTGAALGLAIMLLLTLAGHHLLMPNEGIAAGLPAPRPAVASAPHAHCDGAATTCGPHASSALTSPASDPGGETCGPLTPWKAPGWDGGERLDRAAPVIAAPVFVSDTCPMPGEPAHLDPPDVRRAFLQVYLN